MSQWQPVFAWLPIDSLVHKQQSNYYLALNASTKAADCAPFIQFILEWIDHALQALAPQDTLQVTPQVGALLRIMQGSMSRQAMPDVLGLADRENLRKPYLLPALAVGLVEMTQPDKPRSKNQRYRLAAAGALRQQNL